MTDGEIEKKLKAIANKRRFAILKILKNGKSLSVGNLASQLKLSFRSTSKHLNSMYNSGLLEREQQGTQVSYKLDSFGQKIISALNQLF